MEFNDILKNAINEAAQWQKQMTDYEKSEITMAQACEQVKQRIFDKYKVTPVTCNQIASETKCTCTVPNWEKEGHNGVYRCLNCLKFSC